MGPSGSIESAGADRSETTWNFAILNLWFLIVYLADTTESEMMNCGFGLELLSYYYFFGFLDRGLRYLVIIMQLQIHSKQPLGIKYLCTTNDLLSRPSLRLAGILSHQNAVYKP